MERDPTVSNNVRLLSTLQRLLRITNTELRPSLNEASTLLGEALGAEKVDVFLFEASSRTLVALGTSETPLGRLQHEIGLDRVPIANGGPMVTVFETGDPYSTGRADQDPDQPRGTVDALGIRSQLDVPLDVAGTRRGVLAAASIAENQFTEQDEEFLQAASGWIGMLIERADSFALREREAVARGRRAASNELARLTRRQREVAACIAEGLSNEQIAERLVLVPGTVANHVEAIMNRLEMRSRVQIAVWAVEAGLYRTDQAFDEDDSPVPQLTSPDGKSD